MSAWLAAGGGFLLAVLWMDLIFDVQALRRDGEGGGVSEAALASIAAYYRRATTEASPMGRLVGLVMLATFAGALEQLARGRDPLAGRVLAVALCGAPIGLALARVLPNAVRLGARRDPPAEQSRLARAVCRDHLVCFVLIAGFVALQLAWA